VDALRRVFSRDKEDPDIYTNELRPLRDELRRKRGVVECYSCGRSVKVDLRAIERLIRENQAMASGGIFGGGTLMIFSPDWAKGSVCKTCNGVLCGPCTRTALEDSGGAALSMPCCPKCDNVVEGIDHITD
jgi:hypothetical protein